MTEYYRQFAFVSSVLAGFAFTFYATLLTVSRENRAASAASLLTVAASTCFLVVTLGTTFSAARMAGLGEAAVLPAELAAQRAPLSLIFLLGILLLLASFGLGGWVRSRRLGFVTIIVASLGMLGVVYALAPFIGVPD